MKIVMIGIVWVVAMTILIGMTVKMLSQPADIVYDCNLAEISVDYPQKVKNECRKMMKE
jgi:hypothetical protein